MQKLIDKKSMRCNFLSLEDAKSRGYIDADFKLGLIVPWVGFIGGFFGYLMLLWVLVLSESSRVGAFVSLLIIIFPLAPLYFLVSRILFEEGRFVLGFGVCGIAIKAYGMANLYLVIDWVDIVALNVHKAEGMQITIATNLNVHPNYFVIKPSNGEVFTDGERLNFDFEISLIQAKNKALNEFFKIAKYYGFK